MLLVLCLRRLLCQAGDCRQRTFREQVPGLTQWWARRTDRLTAMITRFGIEAAGRAGVRLLEAAGVSVSRDTVLRAVMHQRLPFDLDREPVPKVLSVDDVAIRRGQRYATMILNAVTYRRVDVLPDRPAETLSDWLKAHPGAQIVCRDGSSTYAQAIRDGAPAAVQVSDRWHLWHGLGEAVEKPPSPTPVASDPAQETSSWRLRPRPGRRGPSISAQPSDTRRFTICSPRAPATDLGRLLRQSDRLAHPFSRFAILRHCGRTQSPRRQKSHSRRSPSSIRLSSGWSGRKIVTKPRSVDPLSSRTPI
jgi:hypothetical protein